MTASKTNMVATLEQIINSYDPAAPLAAASTIPSSWYTDDRVLNLENESVFARSWQVAARLDQLAKPGDYVTSEIGNEPIVIVRGNDHLLRGFFNVCRHHAAAVMTEAEGCAKQLRCPYHGWTYSLDGSLNGTPEFLGVANFDPAKNGLIPVETAIWGKWVFVRLSRGPGVLPAESSIEEFLGRDLVEQIDRLELHKLNWAERRHYQLDCNWKVFVDNYLDGGYHVPHLHKGLDGVLNYANYTIEYGERFCLQSSPMVTSGSETAKVRQGDRALYYWIYPNLMLNYYDGVFDTNLVRPLGIDRTEVIFDFYFTDISAAALERNLSSIRVGERIQHEDVAICASVQRGLHSRAYSTGRLSVRREAGEHLFHRRLHADLVANLP